MQTQFSVDFRADTWRIYMNDMTCSIGERKSGLKSSKIYAADVETPTCGPVIHCTIDQTTGQL